MIDDCGDLCRGASALQGSMLLLKSLLDPSGLDPAELRSLARLAIDPTSGEVLGRTDCHELADGGMSAIDRDIAASRR